MSSPSTRDSVAEARSKEIDRALKEVSLGSHCLHNCSETDYLERRRPRAWTVKD